MLSVELGGSVHSDDPAYFGGDITDNYLGATKHLIPNQQEVIQLAANAIDASFLPTARKEELHRPLFHVVEKLQLNCKKGNEQIP